MAPLTSSGQGRRPEAVEVGSKAEQQGLAKVKIWKRPVGLGHQHCNDASPLPAVIERKSDDPILRFKGARIVHDLCTVTPSLSTFYVQQRTLPTRNPRFDCSATSGAGFACQRCRIQNTEWTGNNPSCETHCRTAGKTSCWQHVVQSARPQFTSAGLQAALCPLLSSIPR